MEDFKRIVQENDKRKAFNNRHYDPLTGEGSETFARKALKLTDGPYPVQYLPVEMWDKLILCRELAEAGSIGGYLKKKGIEATQEAIALFMVEFVQERFRYDFEFYAYLCLVIKDKVTKRDIPFKLNRGQRRLLRALEYQRLKGEPIRVIVLKARQWGGSTLVQLYMLWLQLVHKRNWNSVVCAHVKDAAKNIRAMYTNALTNYPPFNGRKLNLKTFERTDSIKYLPERGCRITVGSAESPDSVRSQDAAMVHYSEVAFFPQTQSNSPEQLIGSISSSVPRVPFSLIALESTAKGVGNFFHTQWLLAMEGKTAFVPVFVPWHEIDIYTEELTVDAEEFIKSMSDYEWKLWNDGATLEAINWYRHKQAEQPNVSSMKEEFPSDPIEAFQHSGKPAFCIEHVERLRLGCREPEVIGELVADTDVSEARLKPEVRQGVLKNIRFESLVTGNLKVWSYPDFSVKVKDRYVVSVDTGGRSHKADYSVITVLDRYWMMFGGKPEVVAQWRGHTDHDMLAWKAAQISMWYNKALLVFESNTAETEADTEGEHTEFIYSIIASCYGNLYCRTPADQIRAGLPQKWGFHTNRATKPMIVDNYVALLREEGYIERDGEACNEARWFEIRANGSYGAIAGHHDDIIMSRMIGLHICFEVPLPQIVQGSGPLRNPVIGEATI